MTNLVALGSGLILVSFVLFLFVAVSGHSFWSILAWVVWSAMAFCFMVCAIFEFCCCRRFCLGVAMNLWTWVREQWITISAVPVPFVLIVSILAAYVVYLFLDFRYSERIAVLQATIQFQAEQLAAYRNRP